MELKFHALILSVFLVIFVKDIKRAAANMKRRTKERMKKLDVGFKTVDNALVIKIQGEIDSKSATHLRRKIDIEYDCANVRNMVFDLKDVSFMDSSGIGLIIGRYKRVSALGGTIKIKGANKTVRRIIELSGLGRIVKF